MIGWNANSAYCDVTRTANYVRIVITPSASYSAGTPNAFPQSNGIYIIIYRLKFPRPSSNKFPYMAYYRVFNSSSVNPTTYINSRLFVVSPPANTLSSVSIE